MTSDSSSEPSADRPQFATSEEPAAVPRRLSGLAVVALLLAGVSLLAFTTWLLWWIPLATVAIALLARYRLSDDPGVSGRRLAVIAFTVALVIAVAAPTRFFVRARRIEAQAERVGVEWLDLIRRSRNEDGELNVFRLGKALQLRLPAAERQRFDATLVNYYFDNEEQRIRLEEFANEPLIHTLNLLGSRATVQHYAVESCRQDGDVDRVTTVCAVTFLRGGRPESFFVKLDLQREPDADTPLGNWRAVNFTGDYLPPELAE